MWAVNGTHIEGCTFKDARSVRATNPSLDDSYGIYVHSGSPYITVAPSSVANGNTFQRNTFEGLERAIEIGNSAAGASVIDQCDFIDNEQGVIIRNQDGVQITRNNFSIGNYPDQNNSYSAIAEDYGIGFITSTGFSVEQNAFTQNGTKATVGSWVEAMGSDGIALRNNSYDNLTVGNIAHGNNRDNTPLGNGLQYLCNTNQNNIADFVVMPNYSSNTAPASISDYQGSVIQASRNTLSTGGSIFSQFYNDSRDINGVLNQPINYYYTNTQNNETPDPSLLYNIDWQDAPTGNQNFCADQYTNGGSTNIVGNNGSILSLTDFKNNYYAAFSNYQNLKIEYENLIEQGNPDVSYQKNVASQLSDNYVNIFFWANQVLKEYMLDSIPNLDSIETWIAKKPGLKAKYQLIDFYWQQGRYQEALVHLEELPSKVTLSAAAAENHQLYKNTLELLYRAYQDGRTIANLERATVDELQETANSKIGFAAVYAGNIIKFFYSQAPTYYPSLPKAGGERSNKPMEEMVIVEPQLTIHPNPAGTWADLSYSLPDEITAGTLVITASTGQEVFRKLLLANQGLIRLNMDNWAAGIYFVGLETIAGQKVSYQLIKRK